MEVLLGMDGRNKGIRLFRYWILIESLQTLKISLLSRVEFKWAFRIRSHFHSPYEQYTVRCTLKAIKVRLVRLIVAVRGNTCSACLAAMKSYKLIQFIGNVISCYYETHLINRIKENSWDRFECVMQNRIKRISVWIHSNINSSGCGALVRLAGMRAEQMLHW